MWKIVAPFAAVIFHEISWLCQMWKCSGPKYLQILKPLGIETCNIGTSKTQMGCRVSESLTFSDLLWMKDYWTRSQNSWVLVLALSLTSCVLLDTLIFFYDPGFSPLWNRLNVFIGRFQSNTTLCKWSLFSTSRFITC